MGVRMISVEKQFYEAFPKLSAGTGRALSRPVVEWLRHFLCEARINAELAELQKLRGLDFVDAALERRRVLCQTALTDLAHIPDQGRVLIVANHPLGALDAFALLQLVGSVRRDVRILANEVLLQLEPLRELFIGCDVFGRRGGSNLRDVYRALEAEQAVILFPSGEVSRMRPNGVRDGRWHDGFVRMARRSGAPVLPVHIAAHHSPMFYGASMLAKPLATLMLPRALYRGAPTRIGITLGAPVTAVALAADRGSSERVATAMRRHVYRLPTRKPPLFVTTTTVAHPQPAARVRDGLQRATPLGHTRDGQAILLIDGASGCPVLKEIGRLRELAFRKVGEGTGLRRDLDDYDLHYQHIVLWNERAQEIVGAYRLADAGRVIAARGVAGLYTSSLFDFAPAAHGFLGEAIELGRSFVQPRYWGSRSLDYLWQGIGAYLVAHPEVRYLFGPVSLSAQLSEPARQLIVAVHQHLFADLDALARARNPMRLDPVVVARVGDQLAGADVGTALTWLRDRLQELGEGLPVLYRQYVDLCEPTGIRFLDFGVDPAFGHCVDGLIRVDIARLKASKRQRYLPDSTPGERTAAAA